MNNCKILKVCIMCIALICAYSADAQTKRGLGGGASLYFNSNEEVGYHFELNYGWLLNKNLAVSVGANYFNINNEGNTWYEGDHTYETDNEVTHWMVSPSITAMLPVYKNNGLYGEASLMFDLIPFDNVSLRHIYYVNHESREENHDKSVFTRFSPSVFGGAGLYHKIEKGDKAVILFLGASYGYFDAYSSYRHAKIDGVNLAEHVPHAKDYLRLSLKLRTYF
jgi:hypothetical protein